MLPSDDRLGCLSDGNGVAFTFSPRSREGAIADMSASGTQMSAVSSTFSERKFFDFIQLKYTFVHVSAFLRPSFSQRLSVRIEPNFVRLLLQCLQQSTEPIVDQTFPIFSSDFQVSDLPYFPHGRSSWNCRIRQFVTWVFSLFSVHNAMRLL